MKNKVLLQLIRMSKFAVFGIFLQCFFFSMLMANTGNSQVIKPVSEVFITIGFENEPLINVFRAIEKKTNYKFSFYEDLDLKKRLSLKAEKQALSELLLRISQESKLSFKQVNNVIGVKPVHNDYDKTERLEIIIQTRTISGKVTASDSDEGLPGVNVLEKGSSNGTVTNINGVYSLSVSEGATIVFSSVGYTTEEVEVGNRSTIDLVMTPDIQQLQELVVVGYGTVKKSDLTGAVSSVKSEELTAYPAIDAVQALQGRAAGVQITANNGEPGAAYKVRIRGGTSINASSDPIYVVDGFVGGALPPPEDIASIEVLKDASATAIYGSRGANGVIMVTTKRGKVGKTNIDFNASYTPQSEINRLDLLNAEQFVDYAQDVTPGFSRYTGPNGETYNTDWQDEIFRTGVIQNYQLGISGGSEDVGYYLSGTMFDQKGIIIGSQYKRYSVTSNIDLKPSDKFKIGLNMFARRTAQDGTLTQEGSGGTNSSGVVSSALKFEPDQPIVDANGRFTLARMNDAHDNAYAVATNYTSENVTDRFQGNVFAEYNILPELQFRTTLGASTNNSRSGQYIPTVLQGGRGVGGNGGVNGSKNSLLLNENYLTYNKSFGQHDITVMAGYSYQKSRNESWGGSGQSFITDAGLYWNLGGSSNWLAPTSSLTEWELSSYYGRLNYSLNDKYLFTFNARYDGSSSFSRNFKWAFFPSGAFAWNMKEEAFMQDINPISQLKWRVSYGITGNTAIGPYQTLPVFANVFAIQNGTPVNAVAPQRLGNDNLTWESTAQLNIGLDVGLFDDRISFNAEYYDMETYDLIFGMPLSEFIGTLDLNFTSNIGRVRNKGFEFALNSRNLVKEFKWDMGFNISANRNELLELPFGNDIFYSSGPGHMVGLGDTQILREGVPVGVFFGWQYDGVYQEGDEIIPGGGFEDSPGGEKYRDNNGRDENGDLTGMPDGQLNSDDRTVIGNPHPDFIWGFNNDFSWKGFDMNIFFQASQGNDIYSYTLMELDMLTASNNATTAALDRWTPTNTNTDVPAAVGGRTRRASTRWVQDGSFIRLKNISLGYNLPQAMLDGLNIRKMRVYISAQNIFTITNYEGFDPEVNYRTGGNTNGNRNLGLDYASYPNAKGVTFGVNLGF